MCMSQPSPPSLPESPKTDDASNIQRVEEEKRKALNASGLASTIITGGLGASDFAKAGSGGGTNLLGQTK